MSQRLPPLSSLRAFASAGRYLSFQRAAAELAVTPTAISHQIRRLEEDLGVPLFRRMTRKLQLTEAGHSLLPEVAGAFDRLANAVERLKASSDSTVLTISAITTLCFRWLAPRLQRFQVQHPGIEVRLEAASRLTDFARDEVDVGIRHGHGPWPGLKSIKLFEDRFTLLASPKLLAKGAPIRKAEDALRYTLLREVAPHSEWEVWFSILGITPPANARGPTFNSSQLAGQAAEAGLGIALINPDFFVDELLSGRLVQPLPDIYETGKAYHLVYPLAHESRPKIAAFRDWLLDEVAVFKKSLWTGQPKRRIAAR